MRQTLSPKSPLGRPASLHSLGRLARQGVLSPQGYRQGVLHMLHSSLDVWLARLLLWLGTAAFFGGLFFFLQYNWAILDRLGKLALPVGGLALSALLALWFGLDSAKGRFLTLLASFLAGMSLLVMGRVYNLHAPPWQFVLVWGALVLPWTLSSRWAVQWAFQAVVFGLAAHLWSISVLLGMWQFVEVGTHTVATSYFLAVWAGWLWASGRFGWLRKSWLQNMLLFLVCAPATLGAVFDIILGSRDWWRGLELPLWAAVMVLLWLSAVRGRSLSAGLAAVLSLTAVALAVAGRTLLDVARLGDLGYLVFAASAIVISGVAAMCMRRMARRSAMPDRAARSASSGKTSGSDASGNHVSGSEFSVNDASRNESSAKESSVNDVSGRDGAGRDGAGPEGSESRASGRGSAGPEGSGPKDAGNQESGRGSAGREASGRPHRRPGGAGDASGGGSGHA